MPITDYHASCCSAGVTAITTALADYTALQNADLTWRIRVVDDVENGDVTRIESMPCVLVAAVSPEVPRPELDTNQQDGIGYSFVAALFAAGVANGETSPSVPDPTVFRRIVRNTFNNKRLSGVSQVGWCEVGEAGGQLFDKKSPAWQRMSAAMVVQCVGRWPRS